jgi:acylphosphatase
MIKTVYMKIYGRVQGVGFRNWTKKTAGSVGGISGWVRNVEDRTVEILMTGEEDEIDKMVAACHKGPIFARVDKIQYLPPVIRGFLPDIKVGVFNVI